MAFRPKNWTNKLSTRSTNGPVTRQKPPTPKGSDSRPDPNEIAAALQDYSNPLSLVRLARLHGTGSILRESLLASEGWQQAAERVAGWLEPPPLKLDS